MTMPVFFVSSKVTGVCEVSFKHLTGSCCLGMHEGLGWEKVGWNSVEPQHSACL